MAHRLAAIISIDIAGFKQLTVESQQAALTSLQRCRDDLIDKTIGDHDGRLASVTRDSMLFEFGSVIQAVKCAVEILNDVERYNAGVSADQRFGLRVGIGQGDIFDDFDTIDGDGVKLAVAFKEQAEAGGICISRSIRDQVRDILPFEFVNIGKQKVEGISRPIHVIQLVLEGDFYRGAVPNAHLTETKARLPGKRPQLASRRAMWLIAVLALVTVVTAIVIINDGIIDVVPPSPECKTVGEGWPVSEMIAKGDEYWQRGVFVGARRYYEMAAISKCARAMTLVGKTLDPCEDIPDHITDYDKSREWYRKAIEAGDSGAKRLLDRQC